MQEHEYGAEDEVYESMLARGRGRAHPERYRLGKPHPDRAKQFKAFAALKGYEELVAEVFAKADRVPESGDADEAR